MNAFAKLLRRPYGILTAGERLMLADNIEELEAQRDELLEALALADAALSGANMNMKVVEQKIRAAIAKAKESK